MDSVDLGKIVNLQITNDTAVAKDAKIIAALYTGAGRLVDNGATDPFSLPANTTVSVKPEIVLNTGAASDNFYVKLFLWTPDGLAPLMDSLRVF
jgi:hypothetical protein